MKIEYTLAGFPVPSPLTVAGLPRFSVTNRYFFGNILPQNSKIADIFPSEYEDAM